MASVPKDVEEQEVELFKEFLRINTMHPNPDLGACVSWLRKRADELGMSIEVVEFVEGLPVVVTTKAGTDPSLPSVVLNCHMDVVPVVREKWTALPEGKDPFSAWEDEHGRIYARGSQDMKCVGAQYLCALKRLGGKDAKFRRTVHTLWVPDEEIGGPLGMAKFVESEKFRQMNIGCTLDEGLAHDDNVFVVHYGERLPVWVSFTATGPPGHGAKFIENTAPDRLARVVERMTHKRDENLKKLQSTPGAKLGDVTTVNWTVASHGMTNDGGKTYAVNVIPATAKVIFDVRLTHHDYDAYVAEWEAIAKEFDLKLEFANGPLPKGGMAQPSSLSSQWYKSIEKSLGKWGARVEPAIFPAATDSRFVRKMGVPAFGFSPMRNIESLLHDHNEYLRRDTFLEGVAVYVDLIQELANLPAFADSKL